MRRKDPELMQRISDYIGDYYRQNHSTPTTREISSAMVLLIGYAGALKAPIRCFGNHLSG